MSRLNCVENDLRVENSRDTMWERPRRVPGSNFIYFSFTTEP